MRLGILSGGGDCGGINALIRSVARRATDYGYDVIGIRRGWAGLLELDTFPIMYDDVSELVSEGGTILLSSRTNPYSREGGPELVMRNVRKLGLDALIVIGGEDTQGVAHKLSKLGLNFVGTPKTMDNDLSATDYTFGFDSAVNAAVEALDRIQTTARSHERVMVVEVMGRDSGWVAAYAGLAGGANLILVPEEAVDIDKVCRLVQARRREGKNHTLIVVSEGARVKDSQKVKAGQEKIDEYGHPRLGGIGHLLAEEIADKTGLDTREVVLGHLIRGGSPSSFDRVYCTRIGIAAVEFVRQKKFDSMVALRGNRLVCVKVERALKPKRLNKEIRSLGHESW